LGKNIFNRHADRINDEIHIFVVLRKTFFPLSSSLESIK